MVMILACTGSVQVESGSGSDPSPPACTDEALTKGVEGKAAFDIKELAHRACNDTHALVAVEYKCTECEPFEQFFLGASDGAWTYIENGTGMSPGDCGRHSGEISAADCKALWEAFNRDERKRSRPDPKKRRKRR